MAARVYYDTPDLTWISDNFRFTNLHLLWVVCPHAYGFIPYAKRMRDEDVLMKRLREQAVRVWNESADCDCVVTSEPLE
jgi:hypothetical protein